MSSSQCRSHRLSLLLLLLSVPAFAAPPSSVILNFTWQHQETGYWCGPASTRIALSTRIAPPSQTTLANQLGTTVDGTSDVSLVVSLLNSYFGTAAYTRHAIDSNPTPAQTAELKQSLIATLSNGYPMVGNIVSGWRPPFYPGGTIYHYIAIVGYDQDGDRALIADPAGQGAPGTGWDRVPSSYWVTTTDLAVWIGAKAYAGMDIPPRQVDVASRGSLDAAASDAIRGWAQDPDAPTTSLAVHLYFDAVPGASGALVLPLVAGEARSDLCGPLGSCNHGFSTPVPAHFCDGRAHVVHAYALDAAGSGLNPELPSSPRSFTCPARNYVGVRRHLLSFAPWGWSVLDVAPLAESTLGALSKGPDFPAAVRLVKSAAGPQIWLIDGAFRRLVLSPAAAASWHLDLARAEVHSDMELAAWEQGPALRAAPELVQGASTEVDVIDDALVPPPTPAPAADGGTAGPSTPAHPPSVTPVPPTTNTGTPVASSMGCAAGPGAPSHTAMGSALVLVAVLFSRRRLPKARNVGNLRAP